MYAAKKFSVRKMQQMSKKAIWRVLPTHEIPFKEHFLQSVFSR